MRILIISQWFDPEPTFKGLAFARELVTMGHQVEVLTGFPNYPGGKVYPGYRIRFFQRETIDGISIIRVPLYPSHDTSALGRILNYASFALSAGILGTLLVNRADVVYVYHPPATVALPALMLKFFRRMPFVYDIQDLWPDTLQATGMVGNRFVLKCVDLWCRVTYICASRIVVLSPGFKRHLVSRGVPEEKVSVIYNWCDEKQLLAVEERAPEPELSGKFNVVFAGTMGKAQALDAVLDAAARIAAILPQVQFVFIGGGIDVKRLTEKKEQSNLHNVVFLPRRPMAEIGSILRMADILLVHLKDEPLFAITVPSKIQAYMAVGRPIVAAVRGNAAELVEEAGAGMGCLPEDPAAIAHAVTCIAKMGEDQRKIMGENGLKFYRNNLSLAVGAKHFENVFAAVASVKGARALTKRIVDIVLTLPGLMLTWPIIFLLALLVRINYGSPVLFCQVRPGLHGRPFRMYKFRTMTDERDGDGNLLSDENRLTRFGRFLRASSLDELPELINVLRGEMSLVGPRPLLIEYLPLYSPEQARRHEVKPGITGWAQVNGRNAIGWDEKFTLDVWYVDNQSLLLDMKILWMTLITVFKREGITQEGHVTMGKFSGPGRAE